LRNLFPFHLGNVIRKLNQIRIAINLRHQKPFPKSKSRLLSYYCFLSRKIKINPSGEIAGGLSRFVTSLIDFSFVRSICASAYSSRGGHAYDPVSLFLLELFRYLEKFPDLKTFLSTDGTLFPSYPHYKGCTYFCEQCQSIKFKGLIDNVGRRILYKLQDPKRLALGKEIKVRVDYPSTRFPENVLKPKVDLLTLSLKIADPEQPNPFNKIFGVEEELKSHGLDVIIRRINFHSISLDQIDSFFFRCPKLPSDRDARIGVRRNPKNPDKIEKIFGFNAITTTSIELSLGLELPVSCLTISGNAREGNQFIPLKEQLSKHHPNTKIDLADLPARSRFGEGRCQIR